jgi:cation transport regulator ChaC
VQDADRSNWMWIFGYGSLMWDGWESEFACQERAMATLSGYRRAFNKLSVANWGTKDAPCPTLKLDDQVRMVRAARGTSGSGIDYVKGIAESLEALGIDEPAVRSLRDALGPAIGR